MAYSYPEIMCPTPSPTYIMNNMYYVKGKLCNTSKILWEDFYDKGVIYKGIHK